MNTLEAFELLVEGKKVRRSAWEKDCYIALKGGETYDHEGAVWPQNEPIRFHREDWELYDGRVVRVGDLKVGDKFEECDDIEGACVILSRQDVYLSNDFEDHEVPVFSFKHNEIYVVEKTNRAVKVG